MIDINFVKAYNPADVMLVDYMKETELLNDLKTSIAMLESKVEDYNMFEAYKFESFTDDKISMNEYITEEAKNVFEKIGAFIARILDSIVKRIKDIRDNCKAKKIALMEKDEKISAFLHAHPEIEEDRTLKERLRIAIESGAINVSDINQIKNYLKDADELIKDIDKGSVDEKSFKGRMEKLKKGGVKRAGQVVAIAAGVTTVIKAYNDIKKAAEKSTKKLDELAKEHDKYNQKLNVLNNAIKNKKSDGDVRKHASKLGMKCEVYSQVNAKLGEESSMCFKILSNISKLTDMFIGKINSSDKIKSKQDSYLGSMKDKTQTKQKITDNAIKTGIRVQEELDKYKPDSKKKGGKS